MSTSLSPTDQLLAQLGRVLSQAASAAPAPRPAAKGNSPLPDAMRRESVALMRVNHAGEVSAQGLYHGQALLARDAHTHQHLMDAAAEEREHLSWCAQRLTELGDTPSKLTPLWYAGSFAIGALAALAGDRRSLGFVAETERQVSQHLSEHLRQLPEQDQASRAVLQAMRDDEIRHGQAALNAGGQLPPPPVRGLMQAVAGLMKFAAPRI